VTSDIPVHREVYGDAAVYFNAYSIQEQANAIESLILADRGEFRQSMQAKGAAHAQQYSRDRIAAQWQSFFEKIARKKPAD
jgi:glycosyltransferase involved in cell wall biosynthesis